MAGIVQGVDENGSGKAISAVQESGHTALATSDPEGRSGLEETNMLLRKILRAFQLAHGIEDQDLELEGG